MADDLKPCPWCRSQPYPASGTNAATGKPLHWMWCPTCEARGPEAGTPENARDAWNRRPENDTMKGEG